MSKHFCACVGARACNRMPLLKEPAMDGVQLPQGWSHFEEAVYFLALKLLS